MCVPLQVRLRGGVSSKTPGVLPLGRYSLKTYSTQGDNWLSRVPKFPLLNTCSGLRPRWYPKNSPCNVFRTAAFRCIESVGFHYPQLLIVYPNDHDYTYFGAQYTACILALSSFALPLLGLHVGITTSPLVYFSWVGLTPTG